MRNAAVSGLEKGGHHVDVIDLASDGFDPVMSYEEWMTYNTAKGIVPDALTDYVALVRKAHILVFVYPTYWSGMPAQMKGWIERVFTHGVAFELNEKHKVRPTMQHVQHLCVISTFGSPYLYVKFVNDNGRRIVSRAIRVVTGFRTRVHRLALYKMDTATDTQRQKFLVRIEKSLVRL